MFSSMSGITWPGLSFTKRGFVLAESSTVAWMNGNFWPRLLKNPGMERTPVVDPEADV